MILAFTVVMLQPLSNLRANILTLQKKLQENIQEAEREAERQKVSPSACMWLSPSLVAKNYL